MRTRTKLALVLLAAMSIFMVDSGSMSAQETEARTISLATLAPPGSTWMRVFDAWNREMRRRSGGNLQLRIYGGGVQGDESEVIRKIRSGRLDAASVTATGLSQIHRPALVFQIPGLIRSYDQLDRARDALAPEMAQGFQSAGFRMLGWADVGQSRIYSTTPIRVPADMASRHPWTNRDDTVLPIFYQVVRSNPVPLQISEVLGAIQTGRVDTAIVPPVPCVALQWCSRLTHMTDMPMPIVLGGTVIGQRAWDELSEEQRTILTETATQFHQLARRNLRRDEQQALSSFGSRGGTVVSVTPAQQQEWATAATTIRGRLTGQIAEQALVDRVAAFGR
ncbi:MAG: TRAP transporter substrate-binding protein DctP [Myxococcota bacterium]|nr:TRAP transporter substrate-binding protein DctP [Myxococcota bacterium]